MWFELIATGDGEARMRLVTVSLHELKATWKRARASKLTVVGLSDACVAELSRCRQIPGEGERRVQTILENVEVRKLAWLEDVSCVGLSTSLEMLRSALRWECSFPLQLSRVR
jgi:hypothetical protein